VPIGLQALEPLALEQHVTVQLGDRIDRHHRQHRGAVDGLTGTSGGQPHPGPEVVGAEPVSALRITTSTVSVSRTSAAIRMVVEPSGRTTIGRRNWTFSSSGDPSLPVTADTTCVIASMPARRGTAGRLPAGGRPGTVTVRDRSASVTSSTFG